MMVLRHSAVFSPDDEGLSGQHNGQFVEDQGSRFFRTASNRVLVATVIRFRGCRWARQ
jgi:hypothetical protein